MFPRRLSLPLLLAAALLSGCASDPTPANTGGVEVPLTATSDPATLAYQAPDLDVSRYHALLIDAADVYPGKDEGFDGVSTADRQKLAAKITSEFLRVLSAKYPVTNKPGPGVVRLHLSLAGIDQSVPVVSTALRLLPFGMIMTGVRSAQGQPAKFTGSVTIAGIARESDSGKVIAAMVSRCSPPAYDISTGMSKLGASEKGITRGAEEFRDLLDKLTGKAASR
jgi:hypothetical protein